MQCWNWFMFAWWWSPPTQTSTMFVFKLHPSPFPLYILYSHEVETEHGNLIKQLIMFEKVFWSWTPHSCCLVAERRSPWAEEGSRLFTCTLFPFLSNPQKAHFGTSPTKTSIVVNGACKEQAREWLYNLGHCFHKRHVHFTYFLRIWTPKYAQKAIQCMFFRIFHG